MIKLLDDDQIVQLHNSLIQVYGGFNSHFVDSREKVASIVAQQYPFFGHDKYPDVFLKAAMLMVFLTKGHCFPDGNKRLGASAALMLLKINGYKVKISNKEIELKTIELACHTFKDIEYDEYIFRLAAWFKERLS